MKNVDGRFEARPQVEVKVAEDEAALRRCAKNVEAAADLDQPAGAQPETGLPDLCWYNTPNRGKIYKITTKYTKWP
jgi:hypothetical protein